MTKKKVSKVQAEEQHNNAMDQMLEDMTGNVDYYRMCYLACFLLFGVSGVMGYNNTQNTMIFYMMIAQMALCMGLGVLVFWFEQKINSVKNEKKAK